MNGTRGYGEHGPGGHGHRNRGTGGPIDLGNIFDEIFEAAREFRDEFQKKFNIHGEEYGPGRTDAWIFNENTDYYPNYSYPPMNVYMTGDRSLVFEFAIAGFEEKDISLSFQGDYMAFSALMPREEASGAEGVNPETDHRSDPRENFRYFKRRLKMKDIEKQKYYVPLDKYAQEKVKAVYKNGILKVTVPPKEEPDQSDGIRIEIVTEED